MAAMRTGLREQREIVEQICGQGLSLPARILILRNWLEVHGYEEMRRCPHVYVHRVSGRCQRCGITPDDVLRS